MEGLLQSKKLKVCLVIAVVVLLILALFLSLRNKNKATDHADILDEASTVEDEGEQILLIPREEITDFAITDSNGILLNFGRENDQWVYLDNSEIKLNQDRMEKVLNYICDVRCVDTIQAEDGEKYHLNQDSKCCIIGDSTDNPIIISIGDVDENTGQVYFALNYDFTNIFVNSGKLEMVTEYAIQELVQL